jgi:uncharacterized protein (TIGR02246 family)
MDARDAARRWVDAWTAGWRTHDPGPIAAVYADDCVFLSHPFRQPLRGKAGARAYALQAFADEDAADFAFGEPIVDRDGRAAVEYRAEIVATGGRQSLRGVTVLRFDERGDVLEHRDYWAMQ